jgi:hypothetical protein
MNPAGIVDRGIGRRQEEEQNLLHHDCHRRDD